LLQPLLLVMRRKGIEVDIQVQNLKAGYNSIQTLYRDFVRSEVRHFAPEGG
jgi:hypothetical protein